MSFGLVGTVGIVRCKSYAVVSVGADDCRLSRSISE